MQFLNQSWANLADVDEDTIRQQEDEFVAKLANEGDIDVHIQHEELNNLEASGFQLVTSKTTNKKNHKAHSTKASSSYLTRSKVQAKPFKWNAYIGILGV